uniref:CB1 cannabinoid receptor-interacting protein 1 n=1 Tax=Syphacia muris TaxID=451379 RepID=A0A0N5AEV0_9BILA
MINAEMYNSVSDAENNTSTEIEQNSTNLIEQLQKASTSTFQQMQFNDGRNSSARLQQYSFNNGQCYYEDGAVVENGQRRQLTSDEMDRIAQFEKNMALYSKQISSSLSDWVRSLLQWDPVDDHESSFPNFSPFPTMPTVPCFCSSCNQTST